MERTTRIGIAALALVATIAVATAGAAMAHAGGYLGMGRGAATVTETDGTIDGRFVTASVDPATGTFAALDLKDANATHPLLVSVSLGEVASGAAKRGGYQLDDGAGDTLAIVDAPRGGFAARSVNGTTLTIVMPEGASIATHDAVASWSPAGATVTYADGTIANLVVKNGTLTVDGQTLVVTLDAGGAAVYGILPERGPFGFGYGPFGGNHGPTLGYGGHRGPGGHRSPA